MGYDINHLESLVELSRSEDIERIYRDRLFTPASVQMPAAGYYWGSRNIRSDEANRVKARGSTLDGRGSVIAIIDSGIDYNHPNFAGNVILGYDFLNEDNDPKDTSGHGTHVSDCARSVAPGVIIAAVKVCDGYCPGFDMIEGVEWCCANRERYNIVAANMSIGDGGQYLDDKCPVWMNAVMEEAARLGIIITVASGNQGHKNGVSFPSCSPSALSIGASDINNKLATFSNRGPNLDLLAPGSSITAARMGGGFIKKSGTSMAAPHAAGAVAIVKQALRLYGRDESLETVRQILRDTGKMISGYPRIDLYEAVNQITLPEVEKIAVEEGGRVRIRFSEPMNEVAIGNPANYAIDSDVSVLSVGTNADNTEALLEVSGLRFDSGYRLELGNIRDRAKQANALVAGNLRFEYVEIDESGEGIGFLQCQPDNVIASKDQSVFLRLVRKNAQDYGERVPEAAWALNDELPDDFVPMSLAVDGSWELAVQDIRWMVSAGCTFHYRARVMNDEGHHIYTPVKAEYLELDSRPPVHLLDVVLIGNTLCENHVGASIGVFSPGIDEAPYSYQVLYPEAGRFTVWGGELRIMEGVSLNYEQNPAISLPVRITDEDGRSMDREFFICVLDENERPSEILLSRVTVYENTRPEFMGRLFPEDPDAGDQIELSLVESTNPFVILKGDELTYTVSDLLDFETEPLIRVRVRATDRAGLFLEKTHEINILDSNDFPTAASFIALPLRENAPGALLGYLRLSDPDRDETFFYRFANGSPNTGLLEIAGNCVKLREGCSLDYETQPEISFRARLADKRDCALELPVRVGVLDQNERPEEILLSGNVITEGVRGFVIGTLSTLDPDRNDRFTYSLTANPFGLIIESGIRLKLPEDLSLDSFVTPQLSFRVRSVDAGGLNIERDFLIPVRRTSDAEILLGGNSIAENSVAAVVGILSLGAGGGSFQPSYQIRESTLEDLRISGNALIAGGKGLDYESLTEFSVLIEAYREMMLLGQKRFLIRVLDVNEAPVEISVIPSNLTENRFGEKIAGLESLDPDIGDKLSFLITEDPTGKCVISGKELRLREGESLDFETFPTFTLCLRARDREGLYIERNFSFVVGDENEAPTSLQFRPLTVMENQSACALGFLNATDPDRGDLFSFSLSGNSADSLMVVDGNCVHLRDGYSLDYESTPELIFTAQVRDNGGLETSRAFSFSVEDENEAPFRLVLSGNFLPERARNMEIGRLHASDPDRGEVFCYSLADNSQNFAIVGNTLMSAENGAFDHETRPLEEVLILASDRGGLSVSGNFTVLIGDENEAPIRIRLEGGKVPENVYGAIAGHLTAEDPDIGDAFSYSIVSGARELFEISGDLLKLRESARLDYEADPRSYELVIMAEDRAGLTCLSSVIVKVQDGNDPPTSLTIDCIHVPENSPGARVGTVSVEDPDVKDHYWFQLVDPGQVFAMDGLDLVLRPGVSLDYERQDVYRLGICAVDKGGMSISLSLNIHVDDISPELVDRESIASATIAQERLGKGSQATLSVAYADNCLPERVEYRWTADGNTIKAGEVDRAGAIDAQSIWLDLSAEASVHRGVKIGCELLPQSGDEIYRSICVPEMQVLNTPPEVPLSVVIEARGEDAFAGLLAVVSGGGDRDGDPLSHTFLWKRDGEVVAGLSGNAVGEAFIFANERWEVEVTPHDGLESGPARRADFTVGAMIPAVSLRLSRPLPTRCTDSVLIDASASAVIRGRAERFDFDFDGDGSSDYSETPDLAPDGQFDGRTLYNFPKGHQRVEVRLFDSYGVSGNARIGFSVLNTEPEMTGLEILPAQARAGSPLSAHARARDPDSADRMEYAYSWTRNGIFAGNARELPAGSFAKGDLVSLQVKAGDGEDESGAVECHVRINNSRPSAPSVRLLPELPTSASELQALAFGAFDPDGDALAYHYSWKREGEPWGVGVGIVSAELLHKGEHWELSVWADDGEEQGPATLVRAVVGNRSPEISGIEVLSAKNPFRFRHLIEDDSSDSSVLEIDFGADGQTELEGGEEIFEQRLPRGEGIVKITARDPEGAQGSALVCFRVENSAPRAKAGADQSGRVGERITLAGNGSDADADELSYSWQIKEGGEGVIADRDCAVASFIPAEEGLYRLALTVSDGEVASSDTLEIHVRDAFGTARPDERVLLSPDEERELLRLCDQDAGESKGLDRAATLAGFARRKLDTAQRDRLIGALCQLSKRGGRMDESEMNLVLGALDNALAPNEGQEGGGLPLANATAIVDGMLACEALSRGHLGKSLALLEGLVPEALRVGHLVELKKSLEHAAERATELLVARDSGSRNREQYEQSQLGLWLELVEFSGQGTPIEVKAANHTLKFPASLGSGAAIVRSLRKPFEFAEVTGSDLPLSDIYSFDLFAGATGAALTVKDLAEGIEISLPIQTNALPPDYHLRVRYWNEIKAEWSEEGLTQLASMAGEARFRTTHFTDFAVFALPPEVKKNASPSSDSTPIISSTTPPVETRIILPEVPDAIMEGLQGQSSGGGGCFFR
ncbi:MAG: cadherin domain-containing protein [Planctomycetes bacterium]|nr:cadherin domain-containing protein [Planctomycetota bacterium]